MTSVRVCTHTCRSNEDSGSHLCQSNDVFEAPLTPRFHFALGNRAMWKILLLLHLAQLASSSYVGGSSMESTHFDRELRDRQCGVRAQQGHWITVRSQTPTVSNSSMNDSTVVRKLRIYNDADDRLMTRVSSETFKINSADPLRIDQAALNVTVDRQVRSAPDLPASHRKGSRLNRIRRGEGIGPISDAARCR